MKTKTSFFVYLAIFLISTTLSVCAGFVVVERYFFDKLLYKKSLLHGYAKNKNEAKSLYAPSELGPQDVHVLFRKRVEDVLLLEGLIAGSIINKEKDEDDTYIIGILSDSMGYGDGVRVSQRFSSILEKKLNQIRRTKIYTLALPGDSILDHFIKYLLAEAVLDIDMYVITLTANDLLFQDIDKYTLEKAVYEHLKKECVGEEYKPKHTVNTYIEYFAEYELPSFFDVYTNTCILDSVLKRFVSENMLFITLSNFQAVEAGEEHKKQRYSNPYSWVMNKYTHAIQRYGGEVLIPGNIEFTFVSHKESHPSATTHRQYANILFEEVTKNKRWGFNNDK